ncbi:hypothetical protein [Burkholderia sp. Nafp2/4-1b]|nr:hypothetical protein [Burkholderia sp. Nafp2/4-1b]
MALIAIDFGGRRGPQCNAPMRLVDAEQAFEPFTGRFGMRSKIVF